MKNYISDYLIGFRSFIAAGSFWEMNLKRKAFKQFSVKFHIFVLFTRESFLMWLLLTAGLKVGTQSSYEQ